ncbi:hypothetical protein B0T14DRAFT_6962 [Immersiella caudata]|uniref:Uncharacterized protein n=1 Tax=Immersiella caudata TaxID=314043 RepID=A0AA40CB16_9PEZI|nr:hypothetical protein B0T14DRAFT_6962 [Immersiella caudata]
MLSSLLQRPTRLHSRLLAESQRPDRGGAVRQGRPLTHSSSENSHHHQLLEPGIPSPCHQQQARWPSGLRRYVKELLNNIIIFRDLDFVVRKGVGSNPTLVTPFIFALAAFG